MVRLSIFRKFVCLTMVATITLNAAVAQDLIGETEQTKRFEFSLHLGLRNMPIGYLAEEQIMKLDGYMPMRYKPGSRYSGGALRGLHFNFGMKLKYNLPNYEGWGIIATLDYFAITNTTDVIGNGTYVAYSTSGRYINIPLMVGLNHTFRINDDVSFWAEAAIGLNHRRIWDRTINIGTSMDDGKYLAKDEEFGFYHYYTYKETYDNALPVAFQIGSGIKWQAYSLGLYYYNLGWASMKGSYSIQSPDYYSDYYSVQYETIVSNQRFNHEVLKTSMFVIRVGFHY